MPGVHPALGASFWPGHTAHQATADAGSVRLRLRCIRVMSSARPCKICGASFASGNKLQQHLKSSSCSRANGAADSSVAPSGSSHASAAAAPAAPSPGPPADAADPAAEAAAEDYLLVLLQGGSPAWPMLPERAFCAAMQAWTPAQHAAWLQRAAELPAVYSSGSAADVPQLLSLGLPILQHLLLYGPGGSAADPAQVKRKKQRKVIRHAESVVAFLRAGGSEALNNTASAHGSAFTPALWLRNHDVRVLLDAFLQEQAGRTPAGAAAAAAGRPEASEEEKQQKRAKSAEDKAKRSSKQRELQQQLDASVSAWGLEDKSSSASSSGAVPLTTLRRRVDLGLMRQFVNGFPVTHCICCFNPMDGAPREAHQLPYWYMHEVMGEGYAAWSDVANEDGRTSADLVARTAHMTMPLQCGRCESAQSAKEGSFSRHSLADELRSLAANGCTMKDTPAALAVRQLHGGETTQAQLHSFLLLSLFRLLWNDLWSPASLEADLQTTGWRLFDLLRTHVHTLLQLPSAGWAASRAGAVHLYCVPFGGILRESVQLRFSALNLRLAEDLHWDVQDLPVPCACFYAKPLVMIVAEKPLPATFAHFLIADVQRAFTLPLHPTGAEANWDLQSYQRALLNAQRPVALLPIDDLQRLVLPVMLGMVRRTDWLLHQIPKQSTEGVTAQLYLKRWLDASDGPVRQALRLVSHLFVRYEALYRVWLLQIPNVWTAVLLQSDLQSSLRQLASYVLHRVPPEAAATAAFIARPSLPAEIGHDHACVFPSHAWQLRLFALWLLQLREAPDVRACCDLESLLAVEPARIRVTPRAVRPLAAAADNRPVYKVRAEPPRAATAPLRDSGACAACGNRRAALRCARCKAVRYCGTRCQQAHWSSAAASGHKRLCIQGQGMVLPVLVFSPLRGLLQAISATQQFEFGRK